MKNPLYPARIVAFACAFTAIRALAQEPLPPVIVSASRTEQRIGDALPSTTLITRDEIERSQSVDLPSLLRRVAGVEIAQNGGRGTAASAFIRGAESRHTLVLIDGVPVNNLNFGTAAIEHLSLVDVERIEIVRGNVSSLYGSAALGGVIQIFTREASRTPQASVTAQAGSRGLAQLTASGAVRLDSGTRLRAAVESQLQRHQSDGVARHQSRPRRVPPPFGLGRHHPGTGWRQHSRPGAARRPRHNAIRQPVRARHTAR
jgi:vitamin B12 transporter